MPSTFPCELRIRTKDTFGHDHEDVRRPTRKFKRLIIGEQALNEGVGNYTKRQAKMYSQENKRLPPIFPKQNIIRQCKNERLHEKLDVKSGDGRDVVQTIEEMRYNTVYPGFIQDVRRDKFYVMYSTPNQLVAYKRYCKLTNASSEIAIDGTGSIVKPLIHSNGRKSGHIFFYAIVINYNNKSHSVHQLLTESQSTDILISWLKQWLSKGAPKPKKANCDSSRALINALSFSLNSQSIKVYIDTMFLRAIGDSSHSTRPPISTYIRLDVAHFIHMISRWKCFKNQNNSLVRSFYMHCVALLIDCQSVKEFEIIFRLICIVALNEREDSITTFTEESVGYARIKLQSIIASRNFIELIKNVLTSDETHETKPEENKINENDDHSDNLIQLSPVKVFINDIYNSALDVKIIGLTASAYYFKDFIDEFLDKAYEFPIWTASCLSYEADHATTSYIEQFFGDKKTRTLKDWNNLLRADVFLKAEYQDYSGSSAELQSNLIKAKEQDNLDNISKSNKNDLKKNDKSHFIDEKNNENEVSNQNIDNALNLEDSSKFNNECNSTASNENDKIKEVSDDGILSDTIVIEDEASKEFSPELINDNTEEKSLAKKSDWFKDTNNTYNLFEDSDTVSHDNWRNKGRISDHDYCKTSLNDQELQTMDELENESKNKIKNEKDTILKSYKKGFYFQPKPDMKYQNASPAESSKTKTKTKKIKLLKNGYKPYTVNGTLTLTNNTCAFDSITQILVTAAKDDPNLLLYMNNSGNPTFKFICQFHREGAVDAIYGKRTTLLSVLFKEKIIDKSKISVLHANELNMWSSVTEIWQRCFPSSACFNCTCKLCGEYRTPISMVPVNYKTIYENGFRQLQESIYPLETQIRCTKCKLNIVDWSLMFSKCIGIELDVRMYQSSPQECKLIALPSVMELNNNKYMLRGIIEFDVQLMHFKAYCRRYNTNWWLHDDLAPKIKSVPLWQKIAPHAAIYTRLS